MSSALLDQPMLAPRPGPCHWSLRPKDISWPSRWAEAFASTIWEVSCPGIGPSGMVVWGTSGVASMAGKLGGNGGGVAHGGGGVLVLGPNEEAEPALLGFGTEAGEVVEAGLVGAAVVIHNRLAEVVAVVEDVAVDLANAGVDAGGAQ